MTTEISHDAESSPASLAHLPDSYATRWGPVRKAMVVEAVESGRMRLERALLIYRMSIEEYGSWRDDWQRTRRAATGAAAGRQARSLAFGRKGGPDNEKPLPADA